MSRCEKSTSVHLQEEKDNDKAFIAFSIKFHACTKMYVKDITKAVGGDGIAKAVDKAVDAVADKIPVSK